MPLIQWIQQNLRQAVTVKTAEAYGAAGASAQADVQRVRLASAVAIAGADGQATPATIRATSAVAVAGAAATLDAGAIRNAEAFAEAGATAYADSLRAGEEVAAPARSGGVFVPRHQRQQRNHIER